MLSAVVKQRLSVSSAVMACAGLMAGCGAASSSTAGKQTAAPTFSPGAGTYTASQSVAILDLTPGAVLYCTTDGTTPTTSSPRCGQPTTVFKSEFLQAVAVAPGNAASAVTSAGYTIDLSGAPIPNFFPAGGTYLSPQTVTISDAITGANIFYTTDGTTPTTSSTSYTAPIAVSATQTLNAIATASNFNNSGVASATYTIGPVAAPPSFSVAAGAYATPQQVGLGDSTSGATIYYTTDGTTPTTSSTAYKGTPIAVSQSVTINAMAAASGYTNSAVASATYAIDLAPAPTPTFSLTNTSLSINDSAAGTTIYYTIDGTTTPTTASLVYGGPIAVTQGEAVQAIAVGTGYLNSQVGSYIVNFPQASPPTFSLSLVASQVSISDATPGATIYYTTNGNQPTTASLLYSNPFTVINGEVVNAIAAEPGLATSQVATDTVVFQAPPPTFSPAGLTSTVPLAISLSDVAGSTIYYTTDGTQPQPSTGSTVVYSGPLTVSSTTTVKAIATATGFANSSLSSATYTIAHGNTTLSGHVLTGTAAVKGAEVQLYGAGQSGYGSSGVALLAQAIATDKNGAFSFTFNCPASPGDLVYLIATGGDSGSGANSSINLMTALGSCNNSTNVAQWSSVTVNEVTTIASAYALSAFAAMDTTNGGIDIGAPETGNSCNATNTPPWQSTGANTCNYLGLVNAFGTANSVVNVATGAVWAAPAAATWHASPNPIAGMSPAYANSVGGPVQYLNDSTIPTARINTLADMLATCVENSAGCSALFSAAETTGTSGFTPADTLQAALNIALSPGNNVKGLLALVPTSNPPYATNLVLSGTNAPTDLTLALTFTGAGLGLPPSVAQNSYNGAGPNGTIGGIAITNVQGIWESALAIDASGSIWIAAWVADGGNGADAPLLAGFTSLGVPITSATTLNSSGATITSFGGFTPGPTTTTVQSNGIGASINAIAIDQGDNLWIGYGGSGGPGNIFEIENAASPSVLHGPFRPANESINNMAIDNAGNIWMGLNGAGSIEAISSTGAVLSLSDANKTPVDDTYLVFDANRNLWVETHNDINGIGSNLFDVDQLSTSTGAIAFSAFSATHPGTKNTYPLITLAADNSGNVYGCADSTNGTTSPGNLDQFMAGSWVNSGSAPKIATGRACGDQLVVDGLGRLFAVSNTKYQTIDEFTTAGALISPSAGYTGTSSAEPIALNSNFFNQGFVAGNVIAAMDGSGNLWVINQATAGNANGNALVEYVGIGAPVVTPASAALTNSMIGARP